MKQFRTSIDIASDPQKVWGLITDGARWHEWNSTVEKLEGRIALGETVKVYTKQAPGRAFPVKVAEMSAPNRMIWKGGMPLGLFTGTRTYELQRSGPGTRFTMNEEFSGLMAGLIGKSIPDLQPAFDQFAADLKRAAEGS